jgi:hypothetical protein
MFSVCLARLVRTSSSSHDSDPIAAQSIFNLLAICNVSTNLIRYRCSSIEEVIMTFHWQLVQPVLPVRKREPIVASETARLARASSDSDAKAHAATYEILICGPRCAHVAFLQCAVSKPLHSDREERHRSPCLGSQWVASPLNEFDNHINHQPSISSQHPKLLSEPLFSFKFLFS